MQGSDPNPATPDSPPPASPPTAAGTGGAGRARRAPAAVRRQAQRADELQAQMIAEMEAAAVAEAAEMTAQAELDAVAQPQPQQPQPQDTWEHRYRTLQGKYDSEMPQLRSQVQNLEQLLTAVKNAPPASPPAPTQQPPQTVEIPEEDYTTYGPEFVDSTRRWARAELAPVVTDLQRQVAELRGQQQQSTGDRVKDRVRQEMDRDPELAGRWQALDTDPGFNQWLQDIDPFSGARRLDMLRHAYASGDSVRTGRFFKAYIQEHTDPSRSSPSTPPQTPAYPNGNGAGPVDLANYAAPGRVSHATPGPGAPDHRIWTTREIQAFYDGRLKGRFRGRDQEADRMERDILAAAAEGRIRNA